MRGRTRSLPTATEAVVDEVLVGLGREVPGRLVHMEAVRRCREAGLPPPSISALRTRSTPSVVDLRLRLRRRFDLVIDACPLDLDVTVERDGDAVCVAVAWLSALLRGADGAVCAYVLTAGPPYRDDLDAMLRRVRRLGGDGTVLAATGDLARTLGAMAPAIAGDGLHLEPAAGLGLRSGVALIPAIGLTLGPLTLQARRRTIQARDFAVPLDLARRVVAHLMELRPDRSGEGRGTVPAAEHGPADGPA